MRLLSWTRGHNLVKLACIIINFDYIRLIYVLILFQKFQSHTSHKSCITDILSTLDDLLNIAHKKMSPPFHRFFVLGVKIFILSYTRTP